MAYICHVLSYARLNACNRAAKTVQIQELTLRPIAKGSEEMPAKHNS